MDTTPKGWSGRNSTVEYGGVFFFAQLFWTGAGGQQEGGVCARSSIYREVDP